LERFEFYEAAGDDDHCLTIATGETSYYANILLTVGAIPPGA
ncbi:MAG: RbsD/FucU family protein, partial [Phycisphaerales bacterium]|nr:RbsD/FucU family protein [Phycisphaerales bacterium]